MPTLKDVIAAKQAAEDAQKAFRRTVYEAIEEGFSQTKVAQAAGLTRPTVARWVEEEEQAKAAGE